MESKLLQSFDGRVWAEEFMKTLDQNPDLLIDKELMEVWFCNAIMTGYDKASSRPRLVKLKYTPGGSVDCWTNNELAEVVKYESTTSIVVKLLNELLAKGYVQYLAKDKGYPSGHVVVTVNDIQCAIEQN